MIDETDYDQKRLDETNARALVLMDKVIPPLQILAAHYPRIFRDIMLAAFRWREGDFFESIGHVVDRSHREMREIIKDPRIPYQERDLVAELIRFSHGAAQVRAITGTDVWGDVNDPWPLYRDCRTTEAAQASNTVKAARQRLAARTGRSMRSVIADTIYMEPAQIDAIAA